VCEVQHFEVSELAQPRVHRSQQVPAGTKEKQLREFEHFCGEFSKPVVFQSERLGVPGLLECFLELSGFVVVWLFEMANHTSAIVFEVLA
jgi:hypothetical protein